MTGKPNRLSDISTQATALVRRTIARRTLLTIVAGAALSAVACSAPAASPTPASAPTSAPPPPKTAPQATAKPAATTASAPAKPAAAATQAPAKPVTVQKAKASLIEGVFENSFVLLGHNKGFFREFGVDPEFTNFQSGNPMVTGMLTGEVQYGHTVGYFTAVEKGGDIKMIGYSKPKLSFALYVRKEINSLQDLVGKSIGTGALGALTHVITVALLDQHGIDDSKVEFVNIGSSPSIFKAVLADKVTAGASTPDFIPTAQEDGNVKPLLNFSESLPNYGQVALIARGAELSQRPEVAQGMVNAWSKSYRYAIDHKDELVDYAANLFSREKAEITFGHDYSIKLRIVSPDLTIDPANLDFMQKINIKVGQQQQMLPFERLADTRFQKKMIETLGPYKWPA